MSNTPEHLKYTKTHEWVRQESNGHLTIGITDHAQHLLGDMVFVELPDINKNLSAGKESAVVESVKAAADVYAPMGGSVVAINEKLIAHPELVNQDPYGEGWLYQIKPDNSLNSLLSASEYQQYTQN